MMTVRKNSLNSVRRSPPTPQRLSSRMRHFPRLAHRAPSGGAVSPFRSHLKDPPTHLATLLTTFEKNYILL